MAYHEKVNRLSFEIVNEQSFNDVTDKARDLTSRGVRRVFAIFVKTNEICEWSAAKNEFVPMDKHGVFEDPLFIRPIAVRALLDAALAEAEVVKALDQKGNPEIATIRQRAMQAGHQQGLDEGLTQGARKLLLNQLRTRFGEVPTSIESRIHAATMEQLEGWSIQLLRSASLDDVFNSDS